MAETVWIDPEKWQELVESLGDDDAVDLAASFCEDSASNIQTMEASFQAQEYEIIRRLAHSMKSSSGIFGAFRLMDACHQLELAAGRQGADLLERIGEVKMIYSHVEIELKTLLEGLERRE